MGKTTRRDFIKKSGFTMLTVGVTGPAFLRSTTMAANSALTMATALSDTGKVLVVIQLAGGSDGLNTVIPTGDSLYSLYRQLRPTLAIDLPDILPVGGDADGNQLGLHPALAAFKRLFDAGQLAVIQGVGYPNSTRSHFRSMDVWHTADLNQEQRSRTGWLGDNFDINFADSTNPLLGVYIGGVLPLSLRANRTRVPAILNVQEYGLQLGTQFELDTGNNFIPTFLALNREAAPERLYFDQIRQTALSAHDSAELLRAGVARYEPDPSIQYPADDLGQGMQQIAQVIAGDLGTRVLYVTLGGFDTHQGQANRHQALLSTVARSVEAFMADMTRLGKADDVLIMTWSEFGRRVKENGDKGTDHGAAAPLFIIGGSVRGGVYGVHPSLDNLFRGDLIFSIDFRSVYTTIIEKWLGVDAREVIGGSFRVLDFI